MTKAIICGYPGIGKSSISTQSDGHVIDLESSNFSNLDDWEKIYVNVAIDIAKQGNIVFVSTHKKVREYLLDKNPNVELYLCYPSAQLKEFWVSKLCKRAKETLLEKDYKALKRCEDFFTDDIADLKSETGFKHLTIYNPNYKLCEFLEEW